MGISMKCVLLSQVLEGVQCRKLDLLSTVCVCVFYMHSFLFLSRDVCVRRGLVLVWRYTGHSLSLTSNYISTKENLGGEIISLFSFRFI